jgi:hypothetical protein
MWEYIDSIISELKQEFPAVMTNAVLIYRVDGYVYMLSRSWLVPRLCEVFSLLVCLLLPLNCILGWVSTGRQYYIVFLR